MISKPISSNHLGFTAFLKWPIVITIALACLYLVFNIYSTGNALWALGVLAFFAVGFFVYLSNISFGCNANLRGVSDVLHRTNWIH
jgi:maltose/maltodextrin transport system permease protein